MESFLFSYEDAKEFFASGKRKICNFTLSFKKIDRFKVHRRKMTIIYFFSFFPKKEKGRKE